MVLTLDTPWLTASIDASPEASIALACVIVAILLVKLSLALLAHDQRS